MDDLLSEFLTETNENLDVADTELVKFEQDPNNADILNNIFRLVHTIKGTCGFIGLPRLATLTHAAETLMDRFREGMAVTPEAVTLVLSTIDRVKEILAAIEASEGKEPEGSDEDLISQLETLAAGGSLEGEVVVEADAVVVEEVVEEAATEEASPADDDLDELERLFRETEVEPPKPMAKPAAEAEAEAAEPRLVEEPAPAPAKAAEPEATAAKPAAASKPTSASKPASGEEHQQQQTSNVSSQSIRVSVETLENLMTTVSELVLTRNQLMEIARRSEDADYKVSLQRLSTVTGELQEAVMRTRMQPIGNAWQKLPRIVRDLARELNKQVELEMTGADTELDRQVLDLIKDPLTHMVRNSADHGLETPLERRAAGKPEKGTIRLSAYHEGGHIVIEIADDGKGLNVEKIKAKAIENGLTTEADVAKMTEAQIFRFIFAAGFSTAAAVTSVSGRGVGMDVVRSNIELIGGSVEVRSKTGEGSTFYVKIPLTLAIVPALIVASGGERFAIPQLSVVELVRIQANSEHTIERLKGANVLRLRDRLLPIFPLSELLEVAEADETNLEDSFIAVIQVGNQKFGLVVDAVFHTEEIVVKPMTSRLRHIGMFSGSTILGDGRVIMIIDPNGVAQFAETTIDVGQAESKEEAEVSAEEHHETMSILLVRAGTPEPKAVPLSLITRLEEIAVDRIEHANGQSMVQYRGTLIPLVYVHEASRAKAEGSVPVLIFTEEGRSVGLVVDEIVDIVEDRLDVQLPCDTPGARGAAIVHGQATAVLDIGHFLTSAYKDWYEHGSDDGLSSKGTLVLVDDSPFYRNLIEPVLTEAGYEVKSFADATRALDYLQNGGHVDIVLSDLDLPKIDGFEFAETLRAEPSFAQLPIIAVSGGKCTPQKVQRARVAGFTDFVAKFDQAGLLAALDDVGQHIQEVAA
ncbi:hybrid sensor histidine kinase/response regulator [Amorphus orientalis]|uniref:Chemotaxis protein CheA n=1 Tax=Amorphus orientalis TaxID=649198 RepID=A0AAE3VT57_9HYPH|nr:chemotaxis protein CheW [Amorphus orientalis]MDQ0317656.1 two-component system chemotaxis sensor kinase CheA [Amorphus orientalis]